jgi:3-deoxy-D-manno-octulosonic-acid transferase
MLLLWIYRLVFIPLLLVIGPLRWWRARRRPGSHPASRQRRGLMPLLPPKPSGKKRVWLQAVSVGEMLAVQPIIDELAADPTVEVVLTTTTVTSQDIAQRRYADKVELVAFFPIDFWPWMARAWDRIDPDLMLLTEAEWWPEHINQARRREVPVICLNARVSDRSFRRMRLIGRTVPRFMSGITRLLAGSPRDAQRFLDLGFSPEKVMTTGNIKVDIVISAITPAERMALREELGFGQDDLVVLGASTWPGEEQALIKAWTAAKAKNEASVRLLLVPRHAERRDRVESVVAATGATYTLRSRDPKGRPAEVCIADTTGELQKLIQVADVVFVGKSLPPHREGQTPVEAAGLGRALIMGPGMANFRSIAQGLTESGAAWRVVDGGELTEAVCTLVGDPQERARRAQRGRQWHEANRGGLELTLREIRGFLAVGTSPRG